jgi:EAL domain-containing protein (putative c-di-GMP-specific phosphodiesterase class I)
VIVAAGINPARLRLEITESLLIKDQNAMIEKLQALKATGVTLSLDDFGTGYSSFSYLKHLPVDELKIPAQFVTMIESDARDAAILKTMVELGLLLGLEVAAEGVETEGQLDRLKSYGCHFFQGYLLGKPEVL